MERIDALARANLECATYAQLISHRNALAVAMQNARAMIDDMRGAIDAAGIHLGVVTETIETAKAIVVDAREHRAHVRRLRQQRLIVRRAVDRPDAPPARVVGFDRGRGAT